MNRDTTKEPSTAPKWEKVSCSKRMEQVSKIGFSPKAIVDGGAFKGKWTLDMHKIFPEASILAIEPNPEIQETLKQNISSVSPRPIIAQNALAESNGFMKFNIWGDPQKAASASLQDHVNGSNGKHIEVEVTTLDALLKEKQLRPDLVKLDLQGAEIRALHGAKEALTYVEMFIVEFGCLQAYIDRATPNELFEVFYRNDYCLYDIVDLIYRPYDGALTGGDFVFVKNSSSLKRHINFT